MDHISRRTGYPLGRPRFAGNTSPTSQTQQPRPASRASEMIGRRPAPFSLSGTPGPRNSAVSRPEQQVTLNEDKLPFLLEQACDPQRTPQERVALFKSLIDQLPPRDETHGRLHAQCLRAMLRPIDPVERRKLFWLYHERHPFRMRTDDTPRLFAQVSLLQKPEHRSTEQTWAALARVGSPGPSTNWPVWRELCRVLAGQMAKVIQAFQQSPGGFAPARRATRRPGRGSPL